MLSDEDIKTIVSISEKTIKKHSSGFNGIIDVEKLPHAIAIAISEAIKEYDSIHD